MPVYGFEGRIPKIHTSVFVADTASVIGDVVIGEGSSVWPGAVVRGDFSNITIGEYTNVQDNIVIHTTPSNPTKIGNYVTMGHGAIIQSASVEDNCLIGMRAIILDHSRIGKNSVIGAGAVVLENTEVPPNSVVVGIPAKIIRIVDNASELEAQAKQNAITYSELAIRYKKEEYAKER